MILCVCRAVSDRTVRRLVQEQGCDAREVVRLTGAGTGCGACIPDLCRMVRNEAGAFISAGARGESSGGNPRGSLTAFDVSLESLGAEGERGGESPSAA